MVAVVAALIAGAVLLMAAAIPGAGALPYAALMVGLALVLSQLWGAATWAADRWIARARVTTEP
jgi:hypothetical protein